MKMLRDAAAGLAAVTFCACALVSTAGGAMFVGFISAERLKHGQISYNEFLLERGAAAILFGVGIFALSAVYNRIFNGAWFKGD